MTNHHEVLIGARYLHNGELVEVVARDNANYILRGVNHKRTSYMPEGQVILRLRQGIFKPVRSTVQSDQQALHILRLEAQEQATLDNHVFYVKSLYEKFHGSLPKKRSMAELKILAEKRGDPKPPKYTTLYKLMKQYKESGQNIFAIQSRKAKPKSRIKNLSSTSLTYMDDYIRNEYLQPTAPSALYIYNLLVAHLEAINHTELKQIEIPSISTFYRAIKAIPIFVRDVARLGKKAAAKKHKYGKAIKSTQRLLERVESDSQSVNIILADENGDATTTPWLTVLIEILTGAVIGWCLSYSPPCFEKTAAALRHAITEREDGSPVGLMEELVIDNGSEYLNHSLPSVAEKLGFTLRYCTVNEPDQKGGVESFFKTLNEQFVHLRAGTTKSNPIKRGDYDSEKEAIYTLDEFREIFSDWVLNVYNQTKHGDRPFPPSEMWRRAINPVNPPRVFSPADVGFVCRASFACRINKGRVRHKGLAWTGPSLSHLQDLVKGEQVEVLYDPSDLSSASVRAFGSLEFYQADAVFEYQYGLTMFEHKLVRKRLAEEGKAFDGYLARQTLLKIHREERNVKDRNARRKAQRLIDIKSQRQTLSGQGIPTAAQLRDDNYTPTPYETYSNAITTHQPPIIPDLLDDEDEYQAIHTPRTKK
jgi:putative transposase